MAEQIYGLIGQAMKRVGAIGKDSTATNISGKQMYKFRGIDAVYNALNPVMSDLGLFIVPEVLEQNREERKSTSGGNLIYSVLKMRFTMYAPDGSNIACTVIGEGMDSGDKASNKAMSVALKYACFQLLMIPTEEMIDPDAETHETFPGSKTPDKPQNTHQKRIGTPQNPPANVDVNKVSSVPPVPQDAPKTPANPVLEYLANQRKELMEARHIDKTENSIIWTAQIKALTAAKLIPDKKLSEFTMKEAEDMVAYMYSRFTPTGTELIPIDGETA